MFNFLAFPSLIGFYIYEIFFCNNESVLNWEKINAFYLHISFFISVYSDSVCSVEI